MDEEEKLKRITRMLEQGCTMLATHHDCGAPLFRCKGEILCPICSFADESIENPGPDPIRNREAHDLEDIGRSAHPKEHELGHEQSGKSSEPSTSVDLYIARKSLRHAAISKLAEISMEIGKEKDLNRLKSELDCAGALLRILEDLKQ
jgi:UPF0148 protein